MVRGIGARMMLASGLMALAAMGPVVASPNLPRRPEDLDPDLRPEPKRADPVPPPAPRPVRPALWSDVEQQTAAMDKRARKNARRAAQR